MGHIHGQIIETEVPMQDILKYNRDFQLILTNVQVRNLGDSRIHVIVNEGDKLPLDSGETLVFGDLIIASLVVVEANSIVRYAGRD